MSKEIKGTITAVSWTEKNGQYHYSIKAEEVGYMSFYTTGEEFRIADKVKVTIEKL